MNNLLKRLPFYNVFTSVWKTNTFRQSSITFLGTISNAFFGAIFIIFIARFLGPASFGILSISLAVLTLISDIGDMGTDTGLVNFIPKYLKVDKEKVNQFLKLGLQIKIIVWLFVFVIGFILSEKIAIDIFKKPELLIPLRIVSLGVGAMLSFSFIVHVLQAYQRFWVWSAIQVGTNALRVVLILVPFALGVLTIENTLWVYIAMPFLGFVIGVFLIKPDFIKVTKQWSVAKEFFKYNKWVASFTILAAFSSRLDTFITARLLDAAQVGLYSAANQLVKIVPQIVVALGTVIAPKMAAMGGIKDLVEYIKKTQLMVLGLAILGILAIPVVIWSIPLLYGTEYLSISPIFVVLLFAQLFFLISVPIHMSVFYYFSKPSLFFWISLVHVGIIVFLGWPLISQYGAIGAAWAVFAGQLFNFIAPLIWVLKKIKQSTINNYPRNSRFGAS